jgi:hypothetical protein
MAKPSASTLSDGLNALYACSEIGYDDPEVLNTAAQCLIMLTSFDPSAFTDNEVTFIREQLGIANQYATNFKNTQ